MYILHFPRVELQTWIQQQRKFVLFCWSFRVNETFFLVLFNPSSAVFVLYTYTVQTKKKSTELVPLFTCQKDVSSHQSAWWSFSGVESETQLIHLLACTCKNQLLCSAISRCLSLSAIRARHWMAEELECMPSSSRNRPAQYWKRKVTEEWGRRYRICYFFGKQVSLFVWA